MLIRNAEVIGGSGPDLRIENGRIVAIGRLALGEGERVLEARGGALLPGLHDHHIHLMSHAAALDSVSCGPPEVADAEALMAALAEAQPNPSGWVRGIGYHDRVAGPIDRDWLDRHGPELPVRIQHRSGRLWIVNSRGLAELDAAERDRTGPRHRFQRRWANGRIFDSDNVLRTLLPPTLPDVGRASRALAARGVTGVTDMTPDNANPSAELLDALLRDGRLLQSVCLAGTLNLDSEYPGIRPGAAKIHLSDAALPPFDELCRLIGASHRRGRIVAIHCVTEAELVFALAALREAGPYAGDRIEHASVTPPAALDQIRELDLTVVTQPHFVAERGDDYLAEIDPREHAWLYRCRSFLDAGIPLAGGSDAPFGRADPWQAMHAAVGRRTRNGQTLGAEEALTPEQALALFMGAAEQPATPRVIEVGAPADLCLLDRPWAELRGDLSRAVVRATLRAGVLIHDGVDEAPG